MRHFDLPHARLSCVFAIALGCLLFRGHASAKDVIRLSDWDLSVHDSLEAPTIHPTKSFAVRGGSVWTTAAGSYRFDSGEMVFQSDVGGRPTGCLFKGNGTIEFTPPTAIERGQLHRFCKDSSLSITFDELYICFYDSQTESDLLMCCNSTPVVTAVHNSDLREWHKRISYDLDIYVPAYGWLALLRDDMPRAFMIIGGTFKDQDPLYFMVNDADEEAVTVLQRPHLLVGKGELDIVSSFDRRRPPTESANRLGLVRSALAIIDYRSDVTIKNSGEMTLDVAMHLEPRRDGMRDIQLLLAPELDIDTVWINGEPAPFIYYDDGGALIVKSPTPLEIHDTFTVRVRYSGKKLLYKFTWGDFFVSYTTSWLPIVSPLDRADYHTTFRFPKHYDLVSSGELIHDTTIGDIRTKIWQTFDPAIFVSFNYGSFDLLSSPMMNGPRLDVYRSKNHLEGLFGGDIKKAVLADIEGSISLFSKMFGPYPWPHLAATEIPGMHGQGFPQLLHLAWYSFETSKQGITDAFRAHEVAHQWFGHLVGWKTYHDQWLSEGFAEYAGAMYVQARNPGNKAFLELVKRWRSNILDVGGQYGWHAGAQVAPIWLGVRCASNSSPASYSNLVYSKGAYVLHMLRNMLHDFRTGSDGRFSSLMRDYVSTHQHSEAGTADFQRVVERHTGESMQWFFDQWVYGVQIPRYEYAWERIKTEDGRWVIKGNIDQFDVDSTFRVFMPVTLVFEDGHRTFVQEVIGRGAAFESPPLADKPKDILFNDYLTILCREKVVKKP